MTFSPREAWIAYLNVSVLLGTLSLALFNASRDQIALNFAYSYAVVSLGIVVCSARNNMNVCHDDA